jgi:hypothetical protein
MNWIARYRLNPDWFFPTDESDSEKTNREEIFELIKNHDRLIDVVSETRDAIISHLIEENYQDPLNYLNQYLDILFGKIDMTMESPQINIYYMEDDNADLGGLRQLGMIKSKPISAQTIEFKSLEKMSEWISDVKKDNELFVYLINQPFNNVYSIRAATSHKSFCRVK